MAVDVEEAGRHAEARRVDRPRSACTGQIAARGDLPVLNGKVAPEGGRAGAVDEQAAGNEKVKQNCHLKSVSKSCYFLIFYNIFRKKARGARLPRSAWSAPHPFLHKTPRAPSVRGAL